MTPTSDLLVVDSWAWLELFSGSEKGRAADQEIAKSRGAFTCAVTLAEVVSVAARRKRPSDKMVSAITNLSRVVSPSPADAVEAGLIHSEARRHAPNFSLSDAFVLQAARKLGGKVLTADPDFRGIKEATLIG